MAKEVVTDYKSSLLDLSCNSKPHISMLTMLAEENVKYASSIVETIIDHIIKVHPSLKLPCLYLVDSIMKNVGEQYLILFSHHMISVFSAVFEKVDEKTRSLLFKLRQTWTGILVDELLYSLDLKIRELDPAWPVTAKYSDDSRTNLPSVNTDTKMEEVSSSIKVIKLEEDRNLKSKKDILNQLVEKHKQLQLNKNLEMCIRSEKVPLDRLTTQDFKATVKDIELNKSWKPFQKQVTNETEDIDNEKVISISTNKFPYQQPKYSQSISKTILNTPRFLKNANKTKPRKEVVNPRSGRALFKKHSRRKHAKLAFGEWEQTRKNFARKDEKISNNFYNVCSTKREIKDINNCSDFKNISDTSYDHINLKQNIITKEIHESTLKEDTSITDDIITLNETDLNVLNSSNFIEPIPKRIDATFIAMQPKHINDEVFPEICNKQESDMPVSKDISLVETNKGKEPKILPEVFIHFENNVRKNKSIDAPKSFIVLESGNEDVSKAPVKRDFSSIENTFSKNEIPEKVQRLENSENDQLSVENSQVLFGNQDQDLRRLTEQNFKGWDQYKKVYPDEFGSPQMSLKSLEEKLRSQKITTEPNSSCDDTLNLQLIKELFQARINQHKGFYMRAMIRGNEDSIADSSDPYLYMQEAEKCFKKGKLSHNKFLELYKDLNMMLSSPFENDKVEESRKIEFKGVIPSSLSKENYSLPSQDILTDPFVLQDTREFILDGQMRTVYFIANKAFIMFENGEPRELTFKGEEKSIHIEGLPSPILLNFGGNPAEFEVNGKMHTISLGTPARELYIDNHPYEIKFGGPPLMADLGDGQLCKIFASGPPPQVVIGTEPCFDAVNKFHSKNIGEKCDIKYPEKNDFVENCKDSTCENKGFKDVDMRQKHLELHSLQKSDSESLRDVDWRQVHVDNNKFNDRKDHILNEEPRKRCMTSCALIAACEKISENQESYKYQEEKGADKVLSQNLNFYNNAEMHLNYPVSTDNRSNRNSYPHWNDPKFSEKQQYWERRPDEFRDSHSFPSYPPLNEHPEYHQAFKEFQESRFHKFVCEPHSSHEDKGYNSKFKFTKSRSYGRRARQGVRCGFHGSWRGGGRNQTLMNTRFEHQQNQKFHISPPVLLLPHSISTSAFPSRQQNFKETFENNISINNEVIDSKVPDKDIESLMKKLFAAGIINSKPDELNHESGADIIKTSVDQMEQEPSKTEEIIPPFLLKSESLKVYNIAVVSILHKGIQCESCGLRFNDLNREIYSKHLDWHFRINRRERSSLKKPCFQHWYYEIEDWIQFEEFDVPDEKSKNFFKLQSESLKEEPKVLVPSVPASKSENELCTVCNEPFQLVWMENEEEWHLHNSVCHEEEVFHPACLEDFKKEAESKAGNKFDLEESLSLKSDSECHDDDLINVHNDVKSVVDNLISQIANIELLTEIDENLMVCSTNDMEKENSEELVLNHMSLDVQIVKKIGDFECIESDLNSFNQEIDILEGKPGEEEIFGIITEPDTEFDHDLPTEKSKMVTMHSGGITLKVKAERLKQIPSPIGITNSSISSEGQQESDDVFRPPTPDPRFQVLPVVKKGKELSGLCVII